MITTSYVLLVSTVEGSWMQKKRQHSLSNTYLSQKRSLPEWVTHQFFMQPANFEWKTCRILFWFEWYLTEVSTMNIKGVRVNLWSQGMKVLFSPLWVRKSYRQEMLFSIVLRFGNMWLLLCLEQLDADWLNGCGVMWRNASCEILAWGGQICQVKSA